MAIRKYGTAYQGSKSKIADDIIALLPARKYFIDAFSGGGALAHCALESGKFEHIIANDLLTKDILEAHFLWTPEQHLEFQKRWITKEEFEKTDNLYIKTCWSFSITEKHIFILRLVMNTKEDYIMQYALETIKNLKII